MMRAFVGHGNSKRRAIIAVQVMVFMVVVLGFAALTLDVGVMYNTRADLQRAADAAALAGVSALTSDTMMQVRMGTGGSYAFAEVVSSAYTRADELSALNPSFGTTTTSIQPGDITNGWLDLASATASVQTGVPPDEYNAVRVVVRRDENGSNGPVTFLFAPIFGQFIGETGATATAVFDDRVAGFDASALPGGLLPFTIHEDMFEDYVENGGDDDYGWDEDTESVIESGDDIPEINLFPHGMAPGNFGLLNIGTPNMGTPALINHIENGVPPEDFETEVGSPVLIFSDDGNPVTYSITGNTGLVAALAPSIETRVGQVVGFFLHNSYAGEGANTVYTITNMRFGRLMDVRLTGGLTQKRLWIQPASYVGSDVIIDRNAPSSGGLLGRIVLAR